jgi:hypothetical protein
VELHPVLFGEHQPSVPVEQHLVVRIQRIYDHVRWWWLGSKCRKWQTELVIVKTWEGSGQRSIVALGAYTLTWRKPPSPVRKGVLV